MDEIATEIEIEDRRMRERLDEYMRTLREAGVSESLLAMCSAEFIKEQTNPDRRYSGC